jgi:outer membrane protein OmpA-like peptidoglycan-associated protein
VRLLLAILSLIAVTLFFYRFTPQETLEKITGKPSPAYITQAKMHSAEKTKPIQILWDKSQEKAKKPKELATKLTFNADTHKKQKKNYKRNLVKKENHTQKPLNTKKKEKLRPQDKKTIEKRLQSRKIAFLFHQIKLTKESQVFLQKISKTMKVTPEIHYEVQGHTDSTGDKAYNIHLSQLRAKSVQDFLVKQGVNLKQLNAKGYGSTKPIASNKTKLGRYKNRRVVIHIAE